jgi:hypothetical protein
VKSPVLMLFLDSFKAAATALELKMRLPAGKVGRGRSICAE